MAEEKQQKKNIPSNPLKGKSPKIKFNFYWIYGIVAIIFIAKQKNDVICFIFSAYFRLVV